MKNKILYLAVVIFASLFVTSCHKDKGNYDYKEIGVVTIDGIEEKYSALSLVDNLVIDPVVKSTHPDDVLEYMWIMYPKLKDESKVDNIPLDTISREKKLDYPINLRLGDYILDFYVINKSERDIKECVSTEINVSAIFSKGFYVAKQTADNKIDMDLHISADSKIEDLLLTRNGKALEGSFRSFCYYPQFGYLNTETAKIEIGYFLIPVTDKEMVTMRIEDMTNVRGFDDWFYNKQDKYNPVMFFPNGMTFAYVSEDAIFINVQYPQIGMPGSGYMGYPLPIDGVGVAPKYKPHPSMIIDKMGYYFFDVLNGRFISGDYHDTNKAISDDNAEYPANGITHEFIFMDECVVGSKAVGFALFKSSTNERLVYQLDVIPGQTKNPIKSVTTVPSSMKFKSATQFATCKGGEAALVYFLSDNKLYAYNNDEVIEELLNFEGMDDGTITYFETSFLNKTDDKYNYLMVATEKGGNYTVYMYEMLGGKPYGAPKNVFKGKGSVKSVQYVSPTRNMNNRMGGWSVNR